MEWTFRFWTVSYLHEACHPVAGGQVLDLEGGAATDELSGVSAWRAAGHCGQDLKYCQLSIFPAHEPAHIPDEESVAEATAVLDELSGKSLVVVSSHNLVLGSLLAHRLDAWRVVRGEGGGLRREPGVLGQTNGVALLAQHGFDSAIQRKAEQVAQWLARQRLSPIERINYVAAACPWR
jgi:hypothetical protein